MDVQVVQEQSELLSIRDEWHTLLKDVPAHDCCTTFDSFFDKVVSQARNYNVITIRSGDELVAVLPCTVRKNRTKLFGAADINIPPSDSCCNSRCVVKAGVEQEAASAFVEYFCAARHQWGAIAIENPSHGRVFEKYLHDYIKKCADCFAVPLKPQVHEHTSRAHEAHHARHGGGALYIAAPPDSVQAKLVLRAEAGVMPAAIIGGLTKEKIGITRTMILSAIEKLRAFRLSLLHRRRTYVVTLCPSDMVFKEPNPKISMQAVTPENVPLITRITSHGRTDLHRSRASDDRFYSLYAFVDNKPVGIISSGHCRQKSWRVNGLYKIRRDEAYLLGAYVREEYRRSGIYTAMLQTICTELFNRGARRIYGDVYTFNTKSLNGLQKLGFEATGVRSYLVLLNRFIVDLGWYIKPGM